MIVCYLHASSDAEPAEERRTRDQLFLTRRSTVRATSVRVGRHFFAIYVWLTIRGTAADNAARRRRHQSSSASWLHRADSYYAAASLSHRSFIWCHGGAGVCTSCNTEIRQCHTAPYTMIEYSALAQNLAYMLYRTVFTLNALINHRLTLSSHFRKERPLNV